MNENGEVSQTQCVPCPYREMQDGTMFHGVYVPQENGGNSPDDSAREHVRVYHDKIEALKVIKEFKTGRLKSFKSRAEAEEYAKTGFEKTNSINNNSLISAVPVVEDKSNNFKAPRSQDLVCFRKLIESGDLDAVKSTVWENPRYLISRGDTPAILQEGCRYNAIHVAVKADKPEMCELILNTVGNAEFIQLLYGEEECKSYLDRAQIMLDLYLNMPDKGLNETPLHFAVKFGHKDVVRVLVSYPHCIKTLPNKYKQMPIDIVCSRKCQEDEKLKREIRMLLEDQYYVPVLRSDDNTLQPVIGEPFSPTSPMSLNRVADPISPRVEVRAFAGPMTKSRALEFRRKWKTPPRIRLTPIKPHLADEPDTTNGCTDNIALRLRDTEKGLERIGRDLAETYQVAWKEHWPFLNDFADFRCLEDLTKLEKYFEHKFKERLPYSNQDTCESATNAETKDDIEDEIEHVNNLLQSLTLPDTDNEENDSPDSEEFFTPPSSPILTYDSSDDEMHIAEEGSVTFIEGPAPTKLDYAVYNAVPSTVNPNTHPNIYRWRHDMQLAMNRDSYRYNNTRLIRRKLDMNF